MMIATLPRVFLLVFLPLAHNYDSGSSSCSVQLRKNNFAETSQLRTSRLLVADIDTELESVYDSEASFWNIKNRYEEDQSDAETVYEESLADEKEKIPLKGRSGLSYTIDKRMLEKIENKGILKCLEHDEEIRENEERLNLLKQKIMNSKIYNAEDQQKLLEGLEKINLMKEKLTKMKLMNTQVLKMIDNQKKLREDGGSVQTKPRKAASSSSDGMREKKKSVRNPIRMLDSQIEKKIFEACRYIDECKNDPNISKQKYKMRKIKKYCLLFGLPFVLIVSIFSYFPYDKNSATMFLFAATGVMLILYILVKKMRSDKKKRDISKPRFKDHSESSKRSLK